MGLTPSAATAADLLSMLPTACLKTFKSTKNVLLLFLLCAAIHDFGAVAMDGGAAAPGHAWTPGRHIVAMPESGHPAIMDGIFGACAIIGGLYRSTPSSRAIPRRQLFVGAPSSTSS